MPSRSLSSAGITDICASVASAPHRIRSYSSCDRAAASTAEVAIASEPWMASSETCTALSAPIDSALRIASVAESGPTVRTVTSPPSRSRTRSASSMACSSISLITLSAVARATVLSAGSSARALPESGTCLTRTTMFMVRPLWNRSAVPGSDLCGVVEEAPAALPSEEAGGDHAAQEWRGAEVRLSELGEQGLTDMRDDVQADEVAQRERPHGVTAAAHHALVDV